MLIVMMGGTKNVQNDKTLWWFYRKIENMSFQIDWSIQMYCKLITSQIHTN